MVRAQMEITKCPFGYLFLTEIELLSAECGFENLEAVEWLISNEWLTGKSLHGQTTDIVIQILEGFVST